MNKLIKLVISYQKDFDEDLFKQIVDLILPKVYMETKDIFNEKDDLIQEILIKIYKYLKEFKINYKNINYNFLPNFYKKYRVEDKYEYILFCNENQLIKYIKRICYTTKIDYIRKQVEIKSLNEVTKDDNEIIDNVIDKSTSVDLYQFENNLTKDEKKIAELIRKGYTEREIGNVLGVSQQVVNRRKQKMIKKIKSS